MRSRSCLSPNRFLNRQSASRSVTKSLFLPAGYRRSGPTQAPTDAQRKALLRCLVEKVVLDRGARDITLVRIVWRGGAMTELEVKMRVSSVAKSYAGTEMRGRLLESRARRRADDEAATVLTSEDTVHPIAPTRSCRLPCSASGSAPD